MSIQGIRKDIQELKGADVRIFGQPTTLNETVTEDLIDVLDILDELEQYEVTEDMMKELGIEDENIDLFTQDFPYDEDRFTEEAADNTYNWSAPVSHDINFTRYRDNETGEYFYKIMVHRYGDVRGNYTEYALLHFDYPEGFLYAMMECNKNVDLNDKYYVEIDIFSDSMAVYTHYDHDTNEGGEEVGTLFSIEDFRDNGEDAIDFMD